MTRVELLSQPAPTVPDHVQEALDQMNPRVFLVWNNHYAVNGETRLGQTIYDARWEIWVELRPSRHPDATNERAKGDRWNPDAECWMRRLQVYETAEGDFAPADERLILGLKMADAWSNRRFYEERVEDPHEQQEEDRKRIIREAASGSTNYYRDLDRTAVGRYVNSGWRHRIR